jgi:carboxylesterase type B
MAPNGPTNLAVKDVINSLKFLNIVLPSFGGSGSRVTLAGQSSGATMIRTLLATPSAASLFKSAVLASDPMVCHLLNYPVSLSNIKQDYGILSPTTKATMQDYFNSLLECTATDTACINALSLDKILNATTYLHKNAMYLDGAAGQGQPIRPFKDGTLVTSYLDTPSSFPAANKPLLITSVRHVSEYLSFVVGTFLKLGT